MNIFQILCLQFFSLSLNKIIAFEGQKYQFIKSHRVSWCICFSFQALPYWGDTLLCRKISDYYSMKPLGPAAPKLLVTPRMLQFISDFCSVIELHWSPWKIKKKTMYCVTSCAENIFALVCSLNEFQIRMFFFLFSDHIAFCTYHS